jgi:glycosyltransferase involved in cell wall biosynthesis
MKPRPITLCLPYYCNAGMLQEQYRRISALDPGTLKKIAVIVVDDGSPDGDAASADIGCPLSIFKIGVDVRWNQDAARNIAVHHSSTPWVLLTDIDHLIPQGTWTALLGRKLGKSNVYRFGRMTLDAVDPDQLSPYKPHPNTWLMTRAAYDAMGGYDERFAGLYGTDADFRDRLVRRFGEPKMLDDVVWRVPRTTIPDASTTTYMRKQPEDREGIPRVKAERAREYKWQPLRLTFPYRQIYP